MKPPVRITDEGTVCARGGEEVVITDTDQIVIAMGARSVNDLARKLKGKVAELYVIGDAREPRTAFEATREGAEAARRI